MLGALIREYFSDFWQAVWQAHNLYLLAFLFYAFPISYLSYEVRCKIITSRSLKGESQILPIPNSNNLAKNKHPGLSPWPLFHIHKNFRWLECIFKLNLIARNKNSP